MFERRSGSRPVARRTVMVSSRRCASTNTLFVRQFLNKNSIILLTYPLYSPNFAPCNCFCCYPNEKNILKRKRFFNMKEVNNKTTGRSRTAWNSWKCTWTDALLQMENTLKPIKVQTCKSTWIKKNTWIRKRNPHIHSQMFLHSIYKLQNVQRVHGFLTWQLFHEDQNHVIIVRFIISR